MMARTHAGLDDPHGTQASLAAALGGLALGPADEPPAGAPSQTWNADAVVDALAAAAPSLNWREVAERLDSPGFDLPDGAAFMLLVKAWRRGARGEPFPLAALLRPWANARGQLALLRWATTAPPEVLSFEGAPRRLAPVEGLVGGRLPVGTPNQAWLCLDLYAALARLDHAGLAAGVRALLELPAKACPEVLCLGLATALAAGGSAAWRGAPAEVGKALVAAFVRGRENSSVVLRRLWAEPALRELAKSAIAAMCEEPDARAANASRALDIFQELQAMPAVLDVLPVGFALDLAALAAHRGALQLEQWLASRIASLQLPFVQAVIAFLDEKVRNAPEMVANRERAWQATLALPGGALGAMLAALGKHAAPLSPEAAAAVARVVADAHAVQADLAALAQGVPKQAQAPGAVAAGVQAGGAAVPNQAPAAVGDGEAVAAVGQPSGFKKEVEDDANYIFQQVYVGKDTVEGVLARLAAFKASASAHEQEVAACMLHNLFDEYRFLVKYPDRELHITARLFGGLVRMGLVTHMSLGVALRYVLEALRTPPGSKLFVFAIEALRCFSEQLAQWPTYCSHLLQVPAFRRADAELAKRCPPAVPPAGQAANGVVAAAPAAVAAAAAAAAGAGGAGGKPMGNGAGPDVRLSPHTSLESTPFPQTPRGFTGSGGVVGGSGNSAGSLTPAAPLMDPNRAFQAINAETLEQASQEVDYPLPAQSVQDKVGFVVNNLSASNLETKAKELAGVLEAGSYPWFANYMVVKRAAQEPNFHGIYLQLADAIGDKELGKALVETTYKYVRILLRSERIKTQSGERSLLKNLGSWLGKLTIARNRPVRHRDLDLKGILYEAYAQGKMIAVLPFVNKVLEPCRESKVFRPPNPWIQGILSLVAEIYNQEKLKLNLKFEIEMLYRNLNLSINDAKASHSLGAHKRDTTSNFDFAPDKVAPATPPPAPSAQALAAAANAVAMAAARPGSGAPAPPPEAPPPPPPGAPAPARPLGPAEAAAEVIGAQGFGADQGLYSGLHAGVHISVAQLGGAALVERLGLKRLVPIAVDRAVVDIIEPVVNRSVTIACTATTELIIKDFAVEQDEQCMRKAAHLMVSSLAGQLALVTCREPMRVSLLEMLRSLLQPALEPVALEHAATVLMNDNLELGCTFIEKAATDKAIREIDERLLPAYQARAKAKAAGQPFFDAAVLSGSARFPRALPESLQPRAGHLSPAQVRVYEDFARIPRTAAGFGAVVPGAGVAMPGPGAPPAPPAKPPSAAGSIGGEGAGLVSTGSVGPDEAPSALQALQEKYTAWQQRLDAAVAQDPHKPMSELPANAELRVLVERIVEVADGREEAAGVLARKIFARMYEVSGSLLHTGASATALAALRDSGVLRRLGADATAWWGGLPDERKWRRDAGEALLRARLLHPPDLDAHLSQVLGSGQLGHMAVDFAVHVVRTCMVAEPVLGATDLFATLETLVKLSYSLPSPAGLQLQQLVVEARRAKLGLGLAPAGADPPGLKDRVAELFDSWVRLVEDAPCDKVHEKFVEEARAAGLLKGDETTDRVLRLLAEIAVAHCLASELPLGGPRPGALNFIAVDSFVRLLCTLIRYHGGGAALLQKALQLVVGVALRDAAARGPEFNGRPFFRIFIGLFNELPSSPGVQETAELPYLVILASALDALQPLRVPGFAFPWLELISHRRFMPALLQAPGQAGWPHLQRLLLALLRFMEPYLRNADLIEAVRVLYKGMLRVLLVLLHDFPEFLCEYHFELCNMVDLLAEIAVPPRFRPGAEALLPPALRAEVDAYLGSRQPAGFLAALRQRLLLPVHEVHLCGTKYNVPLLNALVFYVGVQAGKAGGSSPVMHAPPMDIFQRLAAELDTEGRYLFLNALANQLRFPNSHTHYYSCVLLYIFAEAQQEIVQEQITRVLLERLIVNRPHPWGLLITFIELIKNPRYNFWQFKFTRCATEIERLFDSVARSCMGPPKAGEEAPIPLAEPARG
ncbi:hypothetical protein WJX81_000935 [Elliptochloris bilobata]|uniref:CCR4-NOT transcription complex subunit 1 n=1 Tax=Elliptochloris bilobata TaxID=381761 RepID=A0AAW1SCZ6_9CHLO